MRLGSEDAVEAEASSSPALTQIRPGHQGCCSLNDAADGRLVAAMLDIPFYVLNFRRDFDRIIDYFVDEYNAGRTPNPCVRCNDWLKFGKLWDYARSIDADFVATGHYARVEHARGTARLLRGRDHQKDQSYVLFGTPRASLEHMLLPIGELEKTAVRQIARERKLPVFDKPDSQEICFVPDNDYASLVKRRAPREVSPGNVVDTRGNVVGRHPGQQHFTIGQRRGLGIGGGVPLYVLGRDAATNTVTVGGQEELLCDHLIADQTNWLMDPPGEPRPCQVKIRYNAAPVPAQVIATAPDMLEVRFDQPQSAVTPGQAVVCYDGEQLIGGGWIR
jgi:tRNA-specific 2-thiouridylase